MTELVKSVNVDNAKINAAKTAAFAYLFKFIIVVYANFGIYDQLLVPGNPLASAQAILANSHLFRLGILADLSYAVAFSLLVASLYFILSNVNKRIAIIAVFWQLIYVIVWVALTLKFYEALRLAASAGYLKVFTDEQLAALSQFLLNARFDRYYGVLLFYTLGSTAFNYLWYRSGLIPRWLAMWGIAACVWCTVCAVAYLAYPSFGSVVNIWLFDIPLALFDITLSIWLLVKGLGKSNS